MHFPTSFLPALSGRSGLVAAIFLVAGDLPASAQDTSRSAASDGRAGALIEEALAARETRARDRWEEAVALLREAIGEAAQEGDELAEARARAHLGDTYRTIGVPDSARIQLEASVGTLEERGSERDRLEALLGLHQVYRVQYYRAPAGAADRLLERVVALARQSKDPGMRARALRAQAIPLLENAAYDSAALLHEQGLDMARESGDPLQIGFSLRALGYVSQLRGRMDTAEGYFREALAVGEEAGLSSVVASNRRNLGDLELARGNARTALDHYHAGLIAARRAPEVWQEVDLLRGLADAHGQEARVDSTLFYLARARNTAESIEDHRQLATIVSATGAIYQNLDRLERARALFEEAATFAERAGDGVATWSMSSRAQGVQAAILQREILGWLRDPLRAPAQDSLMAMLPQPVDPPPGVDAATEPSTGGAGIPQRMPRGGAAVVEPATAGSSVQNEIGRLRERAAVHLREGDAESAIELLREARDRAEAEGDPALVGLVLLDLSNAFEEGGDLARAGGAAARSWLVFARLASLQGMQIAYSALMRQSPLMRGREPASEEEDLNRLFRAMVEAGGSTPAPRDLTSWVQEVKALQQVAVYAAMDGLEGHRTAVAYADTAAALRARLAVYAGEEPDRLSFAEADDGLFSRWIRSTLSLAPAVGERQAALAALGIAERGRAQALLDLMRGASEDIRPGTDLAAEARASLRGVDAPVLYYTIASDELVIWLATPDGEAHAVRRSLVPEIRRAQYDSVPYFSDGNKQAYATDSIALLVDGLRSGMGAVGNRDAGDGTRGLTLRRRAGDRLTYEDAEAELSATLLPRAILERLPDAGELIVVPYGPLNLVPFSALHPDGVSEPLGIRYALRYAPSLATLVEAQSRLWTTVEGTPPASAVVVGNPAMPQSFDGEEFYTLEPLPGAERESGAVAELLGTEPLTGEEASEGRVARSFEDATVVHLATHGLAYSSESRARDSWIALAPDSEHDGFLTAGEILDHPRDLVADLVVLSACESGLGTLNQAEGTVGLQRALLAKGAKSVLVSQWKVDDRTTAALMEAFYRAWLDGEGEVSKSEALRRAMASVRQQQADPLYWAAFQLVGAR